MASGNHRRLLAGLAHFTGRIGCTAVAVLVLSAPTWAADTESLAGVWRSRGYDLVLSIDGDHFALYETTPACCLKVDEGARSALRPLVGSLHLDAEGTLHTQDDTSIAPVVWQRIEQMPDLPRLDGGDGTHRPLLAFDIVWHTFDDNYAFFELRGVDWQAAREKYRGQLSEQSTAAELFEVLASMLASLDDNHVELNAQGYDFELHRTLPDFPLVRKWRAQYDAGSQDQELVDFVRGKYGQYVQTSAQRIADQMPTTALSSGADDKLVWGLLPGNVGYLGIRAMAGFMADNDADPTEQLTALDAALDRALGELAGARAMIVDVRFNGGGWDPAAVRIAGRFADRRRAAFTKKARTAEGFTPPFTVYVEPTGAQQFTRPVILLTSPMTASAAEIFVFCMNVLPHVTQAGLPTMGIHSDQLVRHLPNGWRFSLSNEVYQSVDRKVYEKVGIPPVERIEMFMTDDFSDGTDSVVDRAIELLSEKTADN